MVAKSDSWATVILAAGHGVRMRSSMPKVLHPLAGHPMVQHVLSAAEAAGFHRQVVVVGYKADDVQAAIGSTVEYVLQKERLGTAHALLQCRGLLDHTVQNILVVNGDVPLLSPETLRTMQERHLSSGAAVTLLSCCVDDPSGLGRVLRNKDGSVWGIVEDAVAGPSEKEMNEINVGVYCFSASWVWTHLDHLPISPTGEYFITDLIAIASQSGMKVESVALRAPEEGMGINDRVQLAKAEAILRHRIRERLMLAGVTILDPSSTFIDAQVEIGQDTVIYPNTTISGCSKIGEGCQVGPNSIVIDSTIGSGCRVISSMIEGSVLEEAVEVGPFSHIRPESHIGAETHIGNYAEIKKSRLGRGVAMGHFSYIGDAQVGDNVNISAGAITCNFDGVDKHETVIGNDAFIGCDTMMVAPITIGDRAYTGAGAVVIHDVPSDTLVAGVPARVLRKLDPKKPKTT